MTEKKDSDLQQFDITNSMHSGRALRAPTPADPCVDEIAGACTAHPLLSYKPIIQFFSLFLGSGTEILLCDTERILHSENPFSQKNAAGMPLGDMEQAFINGEHYRGIPCTVNYRSLSDEGEKLRSATMFIKDENDELLGMLTVNTKVNELIAARDLIDRVINGEEPNINGMAAPLKPPQYYETISMLSVIEMTNSTIDKSITRYGVPSDRLTADEKLAIVRELDKMGAFLMKGSVAEVAKRLSSSEATIYRYLQQINE